MNKKYLASIVAVAMMGVSISTYAATIENRITEITGNIVSIGLHVNGLTTNNGWVDFPINQQLSKNFKLNSNIDLQTLGNAITGKTEATIDKVRVGHTEIKAKGEIVVKDGNTSQTYNTMNNDSAKGARPQFKLNGAPDFYTVGLTGNKGEGADGFKNNFAKEQVGSYIDPVGADIDPVKDIQYDVSGENFTIYKDTDGTWYVKQPVSIDIAYSHLWSGGMQGWPESGYDTPLEGTFVTGDVKYDKAGNISFDKTGTKKVFIAKGYENNPEAYIKENSTFILDETTNILDVPMNDSIEPHLIKGEAQVSKVEEVRI